MTDVLKAGPQMRITLHFAVRLMDGTELDSTFGGEPATFVWGDESLPHSFERALLGLKAGDKRSVFLSAEDGFGEYNPDNVQHFRRDTFPEDADLTPGVVMNFADAARTELPGVITGTEGDWVTVDFNHPLAGRELTFVVEVINIAHDAPDQPVTLR